MPAQGRVERTAKEPLPHRRHRRPWQVSVDDEERMREQSLLLLNDFWSMLSPGGAAPD
jgi:hypothetical protein